MKYTRTNPRHPCVAIGRNGTVIQLEGYGDVALDYSEWVPSESCPEPSEQANESGIHRGTLTLTTDGVEVIVVARRGGPFRAWLAEEDEIAWN